MDGKNLPAGACAKESQVSAAVNALGREASLLNDVYSNLEGHLEERLKSVMLCQHPQVTEAKGECLDAAEPVGLASEIASRTATIVRTRERMERFTEDFLRRLEL